MIEAAERADVVRWADATLETLELPGVAVHIEWNRRFTSRLGDAQLMPDKKLGIVRLSEKLWPRATPVDRYETVVHEVCHLACRILHPDAKRAHGPQWKALMARCGFPGARRSHQVDTRGLRKPLRRFEVHCPKCQYGFLVKKSTFRKLKKFTHTKCGTFLRAGNASLPVFDIDFK